SVLQVPSQVNSHAPSQERIAFTIGLNKLKSAKPSNLCKRVLLLNSMGSIINSMPSLASEPIPLKFQTKEEWRKYMVQEFLASQANPNIPFNILASPKSLQVDPLSVLMNCLRISQKKRSIASGIRAVRNKTINKVGLRARF
ncbi:hypothetical protein L0F63_006468, partial [Massospora cicadina]